MSMPISQCLIAKAIKDEKSYDELLSRMKYNIGKGGYSVFGCECKPPCKMPTQKEMDKLNERLLTDINKERQRTKRF